MAAVSLPRHRLISSIMKPKKHLSPTATEAAAPATTRELLPGEATAAKFRHITTEEQEARRSKAYKYITMDDIMSGRV